MIILLGLFIFGSATLYSTTVPEKVVIKEERTWKCERIKGSLDCNRVKK